ncbi:MAG: metallophosphoesterase [Thermoprotei archaeon]
MVLTTHINPPALYFTTSKTLVIAELHLGLGLVASTTSIAESVYQTCANDLKTLVSNVDAKCLIINGDFKESIGQPSRYELELIKRFENLANDLFDDVVLVKGNHDGLIANYVNFRVVASYSLVEDGLAINIQHGHRIIKPKPSVLVLGHLHPSVCLPDGSRVFAWVFFKHKKGVAGNRLSKVIIMPPFNRFVGGGSLNDRKLLNRFHFDQSEWETIVVGVNGLIFGELGSFAFEC